MGTKSRVIFKVDESRRRRLKGPSCLRRRKHVVLVEICRDPIVNFTEKKKVPVSTRDGESSLVDGCPQHVCVDDSVFLSHREVVQSDLITTFVKVIQENNTNHTFAGRYSEQSSLSFRRPLK